MQRPERFVRRAKTLSRYSPLRSARPSVLARLPGSVSSAIIFSVLSILLSSRLEKPNPPRSLPLYYIEVLALSLDSTSLKMDA